MHIHINETHSSMHLHVLAEVEECEFVTIDLYMLGIITFTLHSL